jgi:glyoxylase-like metal-dependent hydrolase (beta-lactamase superfamily II)
VTRVEPPADPRLTWDLPPLGQLPREARLDELVSRVLAPNAGMMSLDGTNTYVIHGDGEAAVVDPGPPDPEHLARVEQAIGDAACRWILVTHHHVDHAEAALPWAEQLGVSVCAARPEVAGPDGRVIADGDQVALAGTSVRAIATPGHTSDHLAFRLDSGVVLTGDHILGRGTSVVTYPEGDLLAYLESLRRVLDLGPSALLPGHGPELCDDPTAVIEYYLAHRLFRERQILAVLRDGPSDVKAIVARVYADVDPALHPAAEQSTRAAVEKMRAEGTVVVDGRDVVSLT